MLDVLAGSDRNRALHDKDLIIVDAISDAMDCSYDMGDISRAIRALRSAHSDEYYLGFFYSILQVGGEHQSFSFDVLLHDCREARLVEMHLSSVEFFNYFWLDVDADHFVA